MSEKLNIYQKLLKIQEAIMGLGKDKSANSYRYVTGDKVLEHVKPLMNKFGLILKQEVISIENTRQDYFISYVKDEKTNEWRGKPKSEINSKVMMKFTWVDCETGEKDENLFGANGQNDFDKGVGSALTYGERYFLLKYFHIATDEDDIDNPDRKIENEEQPINNPKELWLNENTKEFDKAIDFIKKGGTIEQISAKYKMTHKTKQSLINQAK